MTDIASRPAGPGSAPPRLSHEQLALAQAQTLASPLRSYGLAARALFAALDSFYGKPRTLSKFKVLELVARVPYQAWEQAAYIAVTHVNERTGLARRIHDRIAESRSQQDNEQWHLLILDELIARAGTRERRLRFFWLAQAIAFIYYQLSWSMFVVRPAWSYRLNADFEDHAEHEYAILVSEHPEWENVPFVSQFTADYGEYASLADVFRQIGTTNAFTSRRARRKWRNRVSTDRPTIRPARLRHQHPVAACESQPCRRRRLGRPYSQADRSTAQLVPLAVVGQPLLLAQDVAGRADEEVRRCRGVGEL